MSLIARPATHISSSDLDAAYALLKLAGNVPQYTPSVEEMERDVVMCLTTNVITPHNDDIIPLGKGYAKVPSRVLKQMNWNSYTACTRKLLTAIFPRNVLATHSLTGKRSPAFPDKSAKKKLDPLVINDIVQFVSQKCAVSKSQVRTSITTKCADECKMLRTRLRKSQKGKDAARMDRENIPPTPPLDTDSNE